jgi:hypothetical protein
MESIFVAWRLLLLAVIFVFPQLLGLLLYFRLSRAPRWVAAIAAILAPCILFVFLAPIFFLPDAREAQARGEGCGMPVFGAVIFLFVGTAGHLLLGLMIQVAVAARRRKQKSATET